MSRKLLIYAGLAATVGLGIAIGGHYSSRPEKNIERIIGQYKVNIDRDATGVLEKKMAIEMAGDTSDYPTKMVFDDSDKDKNRKFDSVSIYNLSDAAHPLIQIDLEKTEQLYDQATR